MAIPAPHSRRPVHAHRQDQAWQPWIVTWEATRACHGPRTSCRDGAHPRNPFELTVDEATTLMEDVLSFGDPAPLFVISGADCFERDDLDDIVRRGIALGLDIAVSPPGPITPSTVERLRNLGVRSLSLSLDRVTTNGSDSVGDTGWRAARDLGMSIQASTRVSRDNVLDLPAIADIVRDTDATAWAALLVVPDGRGSDSSALTAHECEDVLNLFYDLRDCVPVRTTECHHYRRVALQRRVLDDAGIDHVAAMNLGPLYQLLREDAQRRGLLTDTAGGTRAVPRPGTGFVFVNHVGHVAPGGFLGVPAGSVRDSSIVDIYRNSELFTGVRRPDFLEGRCGSCEYKTVCGGSRSRAYNATGNIYAEEPMCSYEPGTFPLVDAVTALMVADPCRD